MSENIFTLKIWRPEWAQAVQDWYESEEYPFYFRNIVNPIGIEGFVNYPTLIGCLVFGIITKGNELAGLIQISNYEENSRYAEVGVLICKKFQGAHIALEAQLKAMKWLFDTKGVRKVGFQFPYQEKIVRLVNLTANLIQNTPKETPIEKNMFFEGIRKKHSLVDGKYHDVIMLGIFKDQFQKVWGAYNGK